MVCGCCLGAVDPGLVGAAVVHVELAALEREIARGIGRNEAVADLLDLRRAAEIGVVRGQLERLVRRDRGEGERPGADRVALEVVAALLHRLLRHDEALRIVGEDAEDARDVLLQHKADGVGIHRLDGLERPQLRGECRGLGIARLLQAEHHVIGGELAEAAVELHAVAQVEGPGLAVLGRLPSFSARSGSSLAGSMLPGGNRTRPLNIQAAGTRSMVETAKCGSSWPMSCAAMPTIQRGLRLREGRRGECDGGGQKGCPEQHAKFSV